MVVVSEHQGVGTRASRPLTVDRGCTQPPPPPLGSHTQRDWRNTSPDRRGTKGAFAYTLLRVVPRPVTPKALRCPRWRINLPRAFVIFCRIKGKSPERFRFRHEGATTGKAKLFTILWIVIFLVSRLHKQFLNTWIFALNIIKILGTSIRIFGKPPCKMQCGI